MNNFKNTNTNIWSCLLMTIILIFCSYVEYSKKVIKNDLILNGNILKAIVIEHPETCSNSYRSKNYCKIKAENKKNYEITIDYSFCMSINLGDTLLIRQKDNLEEVLKFKEDAKPSNFNYELFLLIAGISFFIALIYNIVLKFKKREIEE